MVTESSLYWLTRLDSIKDLLIAIGAIGLVLCTMTALVFCGLCSDTDIGTKEHIRYRRCAYRFMLGAIVGLVLCIIHALTPTSREYAAIKVIPKLANDQTFVQLSNDASEISRLACEWIKVQLKPEDTKNK